MSQKIVFAMPTVKRPYQQALDALRAAVPAVEALGFKHALVQEIGNPYIGCARATMLRKALDAKADMVIFLDHDISYRPEDLVRLVQTEAGIAAGLYRFKTPEEVYMGVLDTDSSGRVSERFDGALRAQLVPAGFLKVTKEAVDVFMTKFPELCYGPKYSPSVDLFNHGAHGGTWWGEDYAFSRRWRECGGDIWVIPDVTLVHWAEDSPYTGNYSNFLRRQPGGDLYMGNAGLPSPDRPSQEGASKIYPSPISQN